MDPDTKEPIGKVARNTYNELYAQISWKNEKTEVTIGGKKYVFDGYCLFLKKDLDDKGITIGEGDQVVRMGEGNAEVTVSLYVDAIQRRGHNPIYGGHTLIKAWFNEKQPVRHK
jgi:hypothetical protein